MEFKTSRHRVTNSQKAQDALLDLVDEDRLINCLFDSQILKDPTKKGGASSVRAGSNRARLLAHSFKPAVTIDNLHVGVGRINGAMTASVNNDSGRKFSFRNNKLSTLDMQLATPKVPKLNLTPNLQQFRLHQDANVEERKYMQES